MKRSDFLPSNDRARQLKRVLTGCSLAFLLVLTACPDGSAEKAGEKIDDAVEDVKDSAEDVADKTEDAVEAAADEIKKDDG